MYKPFDVAQAVPASGQTQTPSTTGQGTKAPRVITLEKPTSDQAVIVHLDGPAVINLADIASENITLVRVGDKLVILFDNKATITIEPVFNAAGDFQDLQFQLGDHRVVDGAQFAGMFPIGTDQSILPAAGPAGATAGANFSDHGPIAGLGGLGCHEALG